MDRQLRSSAIKWWGKQGSLIKTALMVRYKVGQDNVDALTGKEVQTIYEKHLDVSALEPFRIIDRECSSASKRLLSLVGQELTQESVRDVIEGIGMIQNINRKSMGEI